MNSSQTYFIGIGASAGGLDAIQDFFDRIPADLPCSFIVLQHQRSDHTSLLTDLLRRHCNLPVHDAGDGRPPQTGTVTVIPPAHDITFDQHGRLQLDPAGLDHAWYPIDRLFESMARQFSDRALGVVLSGTGSDGTLGARALKDGGGTVFVQEPSSAGFDGMPTAAIDAGLADLVGRPRDLARQLVALCRGDSDLPGHGNVEIPSHTRHQIVSTLRNVNPTDFSFYKDDFVDHRIRRRMRFNQIHDPDEYLRRLIHLPGEQTRLGRDLTLRVVEFFGWRDAAVAIQEHFRQRLADHPVGLPFRVWVPGCSTGEEAVGIAICLIEALQDIGTEVSLQVFASDIDESALQIARRGVYPNSIAASIEPARLNRFFERSQDGWQVSRSIRNIIVFARHDIGIDPPYTRLDLVICHNLLTNYRDNVQRSIVERLLYALRAGGEVLLGADEQLETEIPGFEAPGYPAGLLRKVIDDALTPAGWTPISGHRLQLPDGEHQLDNVSVQDQQLTEFLLEEVLVDNNAAALIVDARSRVLAAHGELDYYLLQLPDGKMPLEDLLVPELRTQTLAAIRDSGKQNSTIRHDNLLLGVSGGRERHLARVSARRIQQGGELQDLYTVFFESTPLPHVDDDGGRDRPPELRAAEDKVQFLEAELKSVRLELRSANHELEGIREQLYTTRDELLGANDELISISHELDERSEQLHEVSLDYENLLRETDTGILVLDMDTRIVRFTPPFDQVLGLKPSDLGEALPQLEQTDTVVELHDQIDYCLDTLRSSHLTARAKGNAYDIRVSPYRKANNAIDGILLRAHQIRERDSGVDAFGYLPMIVGAYEELYMEEPADASVLRSLDQVSRFKPIAFAAYWDTVHTFVRPAQIRVSGRALQDLSPAQPQPVRFLDERDLRVCFEGSRAKAAVLVNPRQTADGPYLIVGSTDPDVFCDGYVRRLLGLSQALFGRLRT